MAECALRHRGRKMKNPLESLGMTIALGVVLTIILIVIVNAVGA